jgi:hypothetical protein
MAACHGDGHEPLSSENSHIDCAVKSKGQQTSMYFSGASIYKFSVLH